uniref:DUF834 domain-containing protein n=1 Tax=Oryza meridionalis TaxID=40149 RepID=A0A0E0BY30_9ORYZ
MRHSETAAVAAERYLEQQRSPGDSAEDGGGRGWLQRGGRRRSRRAMAVVAVGDGAADGGEQRRWATAPRTAVGTAPRAWRADAREESRCKRGAKGEMGGGMCVGSTVG